MMEEFLSTRLSEGFRRLNQALHTDRVEKPSPVLPPLIIAAWYDHPRLASIAFNETSELLAAATEDIRRENLLLQVQMGTVNEETYVNVLMSLGLGVQLEREAKSILFRRGRNFEVDSHNGSYYERVLRDAWTDFTSK